MAEKKVVDKKVTVQTTTTDEVPPKRPTRSVAEGKKGVTRERVAGVVLILLLAAWLIYEKAVDWGKSDEKSDVAEAAAARQKESNTTAGNITPPQPAAAIVPPAQSKQESPPKGKGKSREAPSKRIYVEPVSSNSVESKESLIDNSVVAGPTSTTIEDEGSLLKGVDEKWIPRQPRDEAGRQVALSSVGDTGTRYSYRRYSRDYRQYYYRPSSYDQGYYVNPEPTTFSDGPVRWGKKFGPRQNQARQ